MRKLGVGLAVIGLSIPAFLHAMGLGEISVDSYLNQPLAAEIQLVSTSPAELDTLQVKIAPDKIFQQIGIERTSLLNKLNFEPVIKNGVPVIKVTSNTPITEPFLNFVIEVAWPKGRLLREYTVLLDPPVFRQKQAPAVTAPAAVAPQPKVVQSISEPTEPAKAVETVPPPAEPPAPAVTAPEDRMADIPLAETFPVTEDVPSRTVETLPEPEPAPVAESAPVADIPAAPVVETYEAATEYKVQRGDTLWKIADNYRPADVGVEQMMIGLLRENPKAFMGRNINRLKHGYILRIPDRSTLDGISRKQARAEVKKQHALWKEYRKQLAGAAVPQQAAVEEPQEKTPAATPEETAKEEPAREEVTQKDTQVAEQKAEEKKSELEIIVPKEGGAEGASAEKGMAVADAGKLTELEKEISLAREQIESQSRENEELRSRVSELEALLNDKDRMIQLKDEQLLEIQQKLSDVEKAAAAPEPAAAEPEVSKPAEVPTPAEEAEEKKPAPETTAPPSDELMPRIPLDAPEVVVAETGVSEAEAEKEKEEIAAATEEIAAAVQEPPAEEAAPEPATKPEESVEPSAEAAQTAALDPAMEETKPGFFRDLLQNPNLLMGTGFGALLLAGLGWLFARRKSSAELEIPAMATAAEAPDFSDEIAAAKEEVADAGKAMGGMLDIEDEAEIPSEAKLKDEADELIESAFESTETGLVDEDVSISDTAAEESAAEEEVTDKSADEALDFDIEPHDPEKGAEVIETAFGRTGDIPEEELRAATSPDDSAGFADVIAEEFPESDEVLAEADVYLAYGLNEQAIDLLKPALLDHPTRADYRSKLLEALYAMEDKEAFLEEAAELKIQLGDAAASSTAWERVVAMGKDIAPESDLFATAAGSVSLDEITHKKPEDVDIDLGAEDFSTSDLLDDEMKETVIRGEGTAQFDAPDANVSEIAFQDTQAIDPDDMEFALAGLDLEGEDPESAETVMMDDRTMHGLQLDDAPGNVNEAPGDATNEFQFDAADLDNLDADFDLDTDASQEVKVAADEPAADDFPATEVISRQEEEEADVDEDKTELDEDVLSASMEMTQVIDVDPDTTGEIDMTDIDLTKDTLALDMLDEGEGEIPLLSGDDEIDTKLDLAKAYLDMGDEEGAKDALEEVLSAGSEEQKSEAQKLLKQLG